MSTLSKWLTEREDVSTVRDRIKTLYSLQGQEHPQSSDHSKRHELPLSHQHSLTDVHQLSTCQVPVINPTHHLQQNNQEMQCYQWQGSASHLSPEHLHGLSLSPCVDLTCLQLCCHFKLGFPGQPGAIRPQVCTLSQHAFCPPVPRHSPASTPFKSYLPAKE